MRGLGLSWGLEFATVKPKPRTMFVGCSGFGMLRNVFRDRVLRTLGGTPNRDPCSLLGLIWGVPRDIGVI